MSAAEQVARARTLADAGAHGEAAAILYALALADRYRCIGHETRMRWWEAVGALERAGFNTHRYFRTREGL